MRPSDGKTPRVIELACAGIPPRRIAPQMGLSVHAVYQRLSEARRQGIEIPRFGGRPGGYSRIVLDLASTDLKERLEAVAAERGDRPCDLVLCLLDAILTDNLVEAVLDDREVDA